MAAWVSSPWWLGDRAFPLADTALEAERLATSSLLGPDGQPLAYAPARLWGPICGLGRRAMADLHRNQRPLRAAMKHADHQRLRRLVEGAVTDAFRSHPDYLTDRGTRLAVESVTKHVVGNLVGHAMQTREGGRSGGSCGAVLPMITPSPANDGAVREAISP